MYVCSFMVTLGCAVSLSLSGEDAVARELVPAPVRLADVSRVPPKEGETPGLFRGWCVLALGGSPPLERLPEILATRGDMPAGVAGTFRPVDCQPGPCGQELRYYEQVVRGLPVWDAGLVAAARSFGRRSLLWVSWRAIDPALAGSVSSNAGCRFHPGWPGSRIDGAPRLVLLPQAQQHEGTGYHLGITGARVAWELRLSGPRVQDQILLFADPENGKPFAALPLWHRFDGLIEAYGTPGLLPDMPQNPPMPLDLPELLIAIESPGGEERWSGTTGAGGAFTAPVPVGDSFLAIGSLRSPFLMVVSSPEDTLQLRAALGLGRFVLNDPPQAPGTAQVNAFRQITAARSFVARHDPVSPVLSQTFLARVNVKSLPCNGLYGGGLFEFGVAAGDCRNAAYSTVIHHEFAHAIIDSVYGGIGPTASLNEGLADSFTVLVNRDPRIAREFRPGEGGRDVSVADCRWPEDADADPHVEGLIVSGAWWDLREELAHSEGTAGEAYACRLFLASLYGRPPSIGPELGGHLLVLDDDDGDLSNGTPHLGELVRSFGRHGLMPPPWQSVIVEHEGVADVPVGARPHLRLRAVGGELGATVQVRFRTNGSSERTFPLQRRTGGVFSARFPALLEAGLVTYTIEAVDARGAAVFSPHTARAGGAWHFVVGRREALLIEDFDGEVEGWTSGAVEGRSDWEMGPPGPTPGLWDPPEAFSPPHLAGTDLGGAGNDGEYAMPAHTFFRSPAIPAPASGHIVLRFRRWLSVTVGHEAWIEVSGEEVWTSGGSFFADAAWGRCGVDLTPHIPKDAPAFTVAFVLRALDEGVPLGGWHLDDICVEAVTAQASFVRGDVDLSGTVSIDDAIRSAYYLQGLLALPCEDAVDANDDGSLNLADVLYVLRYLFSGGAPPPDPFPSAGVDPSPDGLSCNEAFPR